MSRLRDERSDAQEFSSSIGNTLMAHRASDQAVQSCPGISCPHGEDPDLGRPACRTLRRAGHLLAAEFLQ
jgi:hypothetical protein